MDDTGTLGTRGCSFYWEVAKAVMIARPNPNHDYNTISRYILRVAKLGWEGATLELHRFNFGHMVDFVDAVILLLDQETD